MDIIKGYQSLFFVPRNPMVIQQILQRLINIEDDEKKTMIVSTCIMKHSTYTFLQCRKTLLTRMPNINKSTIDICQFLFRRAFMDRLVETLILFVKRLELCDEESTARYFAEFIIGTSSFNYIVVNSIFNLILDLYKKHSDNSYRSGTIVFTISPEQEDIYSLAREKIQRIGVRLKTGEQREIVINDGETFQVQVPSQFFIYVIVYDMMFNVGKLTADIKSIPILLEAYYGLTNIYKNICYIYLFQLHTVNSMLGNIREQYNRRGMYGLSDDVIADKINEIDDKTYKYGFRPLGVNLEPDPYSDTETPGLPHRFEHEYLHGMPYSFATNIYEDHKVYLLIYLFRGNGLHPDDRDIIDEETIAKNFNKKEFKRIVRTAIVENGPGLYTTEAEKANLIHNTNIKDHILFIHVDI